MNIIINILIIIDLIALLILIVQSIVIKKQRKEAIFDAQIAERNNKNNTNNIKEMMDKLLIQFIKDNLSFEISPSEKKVYWNINEHSEVENSWFFDTITKKDYKELCTLLIKVLKEEV